MFKLSHHALLIVGTVLATRACAMDISESEPQNGSARSDAAPERTIVVEPNTKYINVANGETVKITAGAQNFNWSVNTGPNVQTVELKEIAPPQFPADGIRVYVSRGRGYFGT
jgi:hypothetical protein